MSLRHYSDRIGVAYGDLVRVGHLKPSKVQMNIVKKLDILSGRIEEAEKPSSIQTKIQKFLPCLPTRPVRNQLKGLYLYGGVGSGKTMLMDLFYDNCRISKKCRFHFNQFMLSVHSKILNENKLMQPTNPIAKVAKNLSRECHLVCLDEFQVIDVADAMVLRSLLEQLVLHGITIVTTSNRPPSELYLNGIQRPSFLPCIKLIESKLDIVECSSDTDYRLAKKGRYDETAHFIFPLNSETRKEFENLFSSICQDPKENFSVNVIGRKLPVPKGRLNVAGWFDFKELICGETSAADFIAIAQSFPVIFLDSVHNFDLAMRDEIRRFITFIDQIYDNRNILYLRSEAPIANDLKRIQGELSAWFDESFALNRTISRLEEISSPHWLHSRQ